MESSAPHKAFQQRHRSLVLDVERRLRDEGYRTIVVGNQLGVTPDIVALKDERLFQVEAETNRTGHGRLLKRIDSQYDHTLFFTRGREGNIVKLLDTITHKRKGVNHEENQD